MLREIQGDILGQVIYLTGSPAAGKSTLCQFLEGKVPNLRAYSYSKLLRDHVNQQRGKSIDEVEIRRQSAILITRDDVDVVDRWLIEEVRNRRSVEHIVIDSHAVTKESYGFRVTPFTTSQLTQLNPDVIVCLYLSPEETKRRITADAAGRPLPSDFELSLHNDLQASLAAQYAFHLGKPCYLIDSSVEIEKIAEIVRDKAELG